MLHFVEDKFHICAHAWDQYLIFLLSTFIFCIQDWHLPIQILSKQTKKQKQNKQTNKQEQANVLSMPIPKPRHEISSANITNIYAKNINFVPFNNLFHTTNDSKDKITWWKYKIK